MRVYAALILCSLLVWSCSAPTGNPMLEGLENISYQTQGALTIGSFDSTAYHNGYFKFSVPYSGGGWILHDQSKYYTPGATKQAGGMLNICSLSRPQPDTTVPNYQAISFLIDDLDSARGITNALQYVSNNLMTTNSASSKNYPRFTVTDIDTARVGNRTFLRSKMKIETDASNYFYEDMFTAQFGPHVMNIAATYKSAEDSTAVFALLNNINWE